MSDWAIDEAVNITLSWERLTSDAGGSINVLKEALLAAERRGFLRGVEASAKVAAGPDEGYLHGCRCRSAIRELGKEGDTLTLEKTGETIDSTHGKPPEDAF